MPDSAWAPPPSTSTWKLSQEVTYGNSKAHLLSFQLFLRNHVLYYLISSVLEIVVSSNLSSVFFICFVFLAVSGGRVNLVPVTFCWQEVEVHCGSFDSVPFCFFPFQFISSTDY